DEQSAVRERRRGARTGAAHWIFEARFILPVPDFASRTCVVANDRLHRAALFLGEKQIAGDGKGRPTGTDGHFPKLPGWMLGPIGGDHRTVPAPRAIGAAKAGPVGVRERKIRWHIWLW